MEQFNAFVYAALPYALGFIGLVVIAIIILKIRLHKLESKAQEPEKVVIVNGRRKNN